MAVADLLITAGADWRKENDERRNALAHAAHEGRPEIMECLLRVGATIPGADMERLLTAARKRAAQRKRMVVWAKDKRGDALFYDAGQGKIAEVQEYLRAGANPNGVSKDRSYGALVVAAKWGRIEIVKLLLEAGAEIDFQEEDGMTALFAAVREDNGELIEFLLAAGADPTLSTRGRTLIDEAIFRGHISLIPVLVKAGADLGERTEEGAIAEVVQKRREYREDARAIISIMRQLRQDGPNIDQAEELLDEPPVG